MTLRQLLRDALASNRSGRVDRTVLAHIFRLRSLLLSYWEGRNGWQPTIENGHFDLFEVIKYMEEGVELVCFSVACNS